MIDISDESDGEIDFKTENVTPAAPNGSSSSSSSIAARSRPQTITAVEDKRLFSYSGSKTINTELAAFPVPKEKGKRDPTGDCHRSNETIPF